MKFRVTMKDPDTLNDAISDAIRQQLAESQLPEDEQEELLEIREEKVGKICGKWFEYGEYLTIEIDTETQTARVVERDK